MGDVLKGVRKGMIRYMWLILDSSKSMVEADFKPTRMDCACEGAMSFVREYFDQNPLSHLGIMCMRNTFAEKLTDLSSNPRYHLDVLDKLAIKCEGDISIQNALEVSRRSLLRIPKYGSREVVIILGSISTCDPSDILSTIDKMAEANIRCSIVSLAPEMYVCRRLTEKCHGTFAVAEDELQLCDLLSAFAPPPPARQQNKMATLVRMGFPQASRTDYSTLCTCHEKLDHGGYFCPRCNSKYCELPVDCRVCSLTLISSPHLARSYHHLFPVHKYEVREPLNQPSQSQPNNSAASVHCFGCMRVLFASDSLTLMCNTCKQYFCVDCDLFVHCSLHNCPGCESLGDAGQ
eukprot:c16736_g1_i3.p1 GENE.c16736_g1_i3~~c16736_g1_i3.p1  ORF type:complete len:403 (+),score=74.79 c16736_g1_i3:167-1210(+)